MLRRKTVPMIAIAQTAVPADAWSPPVQAVWSTDRATPPVAVTVAAAGRLSMRGPASFAVRVVAKGPGVAISPFLQATRGIAFEVTRRDGTRVAPALPMAVSPPPPPLAADAMTAVTDARPMTVHVREAARTIFPAAGRYRVRAIVFLMDVSHGPARYARVASDPVEVDVAR